VFRTVVVQPAVAANSAIMKTMRVMPPRPKLDDPAHEMRRFEQQRSAAVRWGAGSGDSIQ